MRILPLGQLLPVAEQHEDDVVRADTEHHDDQEWSQLGADGEPEPLREARREGLAIWCTNPTTSRGRKAMMTLRNTKASRHRISSTVAMEMIFSARLKAEA